MGREETTLPPTFPSAAAASASGAELVAASARGGRRARGWRGPYRPRGDRIVGRVAVRAGLPRSFHSFSSEQIHSLYSRLGFFSPIKKKNRWVRGKGTGKAPLSGLEKESSYTLTEREKERESWGAGGDRGSEVLP